MNIQHRIVSKQNIKNSYKKGLLYIYWLKRLRLVVSPVIVKRMEWWIDEWDHNSIDVIQSTSTITIHHDDHTLVIGKVLSWFGTILIGRVISWSRHWITVYAIQSGIFERKYVKKNSVSNHKKLVFLSLISLLQHWHTVAIEENERIV